MLIPNHPHEERLSAFASADADAVADAELASHVGECPRCGTTVAELATLRASLAELPDLRPSRPLRLLPGVAEAPAAAGPADRLAGLVRRLFGPALAAGAAIAMVGMVGTTVPGVTQGIFQDVGDTLSAGGDGAAPAEVNAHRSERPMVGEPGTAAEGDSAELEERGGDSTANDLSQGDLPAERSPWPMVLFTGVAIIIMALMLRWILVPRAG